MRLSKDIRIKWMNRGIANSFDYNVKGHKGKVIEINKALLSYPKLFKPVLKHELRHSDKTFSLYDFKIDLSNKDKIPNVQTFLFYTQNPSALTQLCPVWYRKKEGFIWDLNLLIVWSVAIAIALFIKIKI